MKTYGAIQYLPEEKAWGISELQPQVAIRMKQLFPKIPKTAVPPFTIASNPEVCQDLEWFLTRYPLQMSEADKSFMSAESSVHVAKLESLEQIFRADYVPRAVPLKIELRDYQLRGMETYLRNTRLLLGDEVGLGKTAQAIGSFTDPNTLPAVVVVQTHLPKQWIREIIRFSGLTVHFIKGTKPYVLPKADVYVMKYSCLAGWIDVYRQGIFRSVVFDEIQELRHSDSNKYQAAKVLADSVQYALGMSATPIYNYGDEIYNILTLLKDGCLGSMADFSREWCGYGKVVKDPKALGAYLRDNFLFLRRTRTDVGRELPVVNKIVYQVDFDEETMKSSENLARMLAIKVTQGTFIERGQAARELDIMIRQTTGIAKAKSVAAYVRMLLESGEPVLLAGWHREVYEIWNRELKDFNPVMYTGSESPTQKEKSKQSFVSGESNLMIISLRSGIGLDGLQLRSSIVVFGELDWSPGVHEQVTGRLNRDGQAEQVTAIYLVSDSGSDPLMIDLLGLKSSQSSDIVDPDNILQVQHSDENRVRLLAERVLAQKA